MAERFEHGGTFTDDNGIVHSFGHGMSPTTKCGLNARNNIHHGARPDSVTCQDCLATFPEWLLECISNPLVETKEGYYVHWSYLRYEDTGEPNAESHKEHSCATPPSYCYDVKHKKWALNFSGADFGGYDVQDFTFYFDSEKDIITFLRKQEA